MKAVLTFNLPDENSEFNTAINGPRYWSVLWDLEQEMRRWVKHGPPQTDHATVDDGMCYQDVADGVAETTTEHWRNRLHELCEECGVNIYEE